MQPRTTILVDANRNELRFITELHGPYKKFFVQHYRFLTGEVSESNSVCWQGDSPELAALHDDKVQASLKAGWKPKES
jgi:hypothetical protein